MRTSLQRPLRCLTIGLIASLIGLTGCGGGGGSKSSNSPTPPTSEPALSSSSSVSSSMVSSSSVASSSSEGMTMIRTDGTKWVKASGTPVTLKGTNLGNWLLQEYWMMDQGGNGITDQCSLERTLTKRFGFEEKERLMKLYHDSWITTRDWDQLQAFGFNIVRIPIMWNLIEDENNFKHLRADAWHYLDWAIEEGKKRGIYVILDMHGIQGGQTDWQSAGCSADKNAYWTDTALQDRAKWLWEQIATRYKDEPAVAAYDLLNEPWGSTPENMQTRIAELYSVVRAVDTKHVVLLPSHFGNIEIYGNPADKQMTNVAFEIHPYPGLFGDRPGDTAYAIHRDWLKCGQDGKGGVCDWNKKITTLNVPLLVGEFQPWQSAGLELGGKIARATYDTYASYNWAATSWAYKLVSIKGGQGKGTWGMVTNEVNPNADAGVGLVAKASTWDCAGWDASFATACAAKASTIKVGGTGNKTYYFVIKTGANAGANPDVTFDKISIINTATNAELITNGNFGADNGWTKLTISGTESFDYNFATSAKLPTGAEGSGLRVTRPDGVTGEINGGLYQAVTLEGGQTYTLSGLFKDNGSTNTWAEMYLLDQAPTDGVDVIDMTGKVDFTTAPIADIENLYKSYATMNYDVNSGLSKWLISKDASGLFNLPLRPTGLKLVQNTGSVDLTWNANSEAKVTSYNVYRSLSAGTGYKLLTDKVTTTSYKDTTAVDGTTYYYTVSAVTADDESYTSDEVANQINYTSVPATIEAETFTGMSGIQTENTTDTGGGINVGWIDTGDWIEYKINVATAGDYAFTYRLASQDGSAGGFELTLDGNVIDTQAVPKTGSWQTWNSVVTPKITLSAGKHTLKFTAKGSGWNFNWFSITQ